MKNKIQPITVKFGAVIMVLCFVLTWNNFNLFMVMAGIAFLISMFTIICFLATLIDGQREILDLLKNKQAGSAPEKEEETAQAPIVQ